MNSYVFPTSQDIYLEVNGQKVAVVEGYKAHSSRESRCVQAFGQSEAAGTVSGAVRHVIEISRVYACPEAGENLDFYALQNFNLVIVKPGGRVIYTGCEWADLSETASLNDAVIEHVRIAAANRIQV